MVLTSSVVQRFGIALLCYVLFSKSEPAFTCWTTSQQLRRGLTDRCVHCRSMRVDASEVPWQDATPSPAQSPLQVVELQLRALQENDPSCNDGIAKAFEFASDDNKAVTGPLPRFAAMLKNGFPIMLNSASFKLLSALPVRPDTYAVRVEIVGNEYVGGVIEQYFWILSKVDDCWKTAGVSPDEP
eukprot:3981682-Amphidinium_carterae.1